ncbi:MAG: esterase-like activity of phytase family protein [Rhizobiales bacterium]|nr:esterase-like activity of phytase family protein [Hyphomicrobiales bacterium]NRB15643.1 esterase-like activity of phytase family protein [Hyphomicrobiales bacterium]
MNKKLIWKLAQIIGLSICASVSTGFAAEINITTKQIDFAVVSMRQEQHGALLWRGGLELTSKSKNFGGFSGIILSETGDEFLAVSDRGYWLKANISYKNGKLNSLSNAQMAPLLNAKGKKFAHWQADSEGLTKRNNSLNDVVVSVELEQALYRYKFTDAGLKTSARDWGRLIDAKKINPNKGLEGVTSLPAGHKYRGWLLATAEKKLTKAGDHTAWLIKGKENLPLYISRSGGFDITDVSYLPNGDIVILERAFGIFSGPQMRIRQICGADIKPNALVSGKTLIDANWTYAVDNMEGLGVHRASNGETILTIISDDNFYFLQRNLMLQFALADENSVCN